MFLQLWTTYKKYQGQNSAQQKSNNCCFTHKIQISGAICKIALFNNDGFYQLQRMCRTGRKFRNTYKIIRTEYYL